MNKLIYLTQVALISLNGFVCAQDPAKLDSIPPEWYGSYHEKGELENPVLILQHKLIEFNQDEYRLQEGHPTDGGIFFKAVSQSDSILLTLKRDGYQLNLSGYPVDKKELWDTWGAMKINKVDFTDLPREMFRDWMNALSKNSFWPFFIREEGIAAGTTGPFIRPEEILLKDSIYRILCDNTQNHKYYFIKNLGKHHSDIAFGTKEYNTFTTAMELPKERPHEGIFPPDFWGEWYATDGTNKEIFKASQEEWMIDNEPYELANYHKNGDSLKIYLQSGREITRITITDLDNNYLRYQRATLDPIILKKHPDLKDGYSVDYHNLPGWLFGYWYSTDDNQQTVLALEQDEMKYLGGKTKNRVIYVNQGKYHVEFTQKKNDFHFVVEPLSMEYLLVHTSKDQTVLLKHGRTDPNFLAISPQELPKELLGNWFTPGTQNGYEVTLSKDYLIYQQEFYTYDQIHRGGNFIEIQAAASRRIVNLTLNQTGAQISYTINGGETKPVQRGRVIVKPGMDWSTPYPKHVYTKGGKFILDGYVLNHDKYPDYSTVTLYYQTMVESGQETEAARVREDGRFTLEINLDHPLESFGRFGESWIYAFMAPGNKLFMVIDAEECGERKNPKLNLAMSGDWAQEAYLYHDYQTGYQPDFSLHQDHITKDDSTAYKSFRKGLHQQDLESMEKFLSERSSSPFFKKWYKDRIDYSYADDLMRFRWLQKSYRGEREFPFYVPVSTDWLEWKNYPLIDPDLFLNYQFINVVHEHNMYQSYASMVNFYPEFPKMILPKDDKGIEVSKAGQYLTYLNRLEKEEAYSRYFKDVLTAREILSSLSREKAEVMEPVVDKFLSVATNPAAIDVVKESQERLKRFSEKDAEEHMVTEKADTTKMSYFEKLLYPHRGKVIYVDFWATWCGPCKSQFPFSRLLHDALKDKDVVFMYLCGSSDKPNWKSDIEKYKLEGDHHFIKDKEWRELCGEFKVSGIPHYLLVDKNGKVVDRDAQRPQGSGAYNQDLYKQILKLLE